MDCNESNGDKVILKIFIFGFWARTEHQIVLTLLNDF